MIINYDTSTSRVLGWLRHDPDIFNHLSSLISEWQDEGTDSETIESDARSYLCETLDGAGVFTPAAKAALSADDLALVDWSEVVKALSEF